MTTSQPTPNDEPTDSIERASASGGGPRANRPTRRQFTTEYKRRIVEEYNAAPPGEKGALLRREGLYHSNIRE